MTAEEMQQIENEKWNMRRLCNVWGVQSQMLNDPENKKFNNAQEAEKALTTRCALPELTSTRDNLNRKGSVWGIPSGKIVDFDVSVFTELQETVGETMRWVDPLLKQGWPLNRALEVLNIESVPEPEADEMWITPSMGQPISQWRMNPVDEALNNPTGNDPNNPIA